MAALLFVWALDFLDTLVQPARKAASLFYIHSAKSNRRIRRMNANTAIKSQCLIKKSHFFHYACEVS